MPMKIARAKLLPGLTVQGSVREYVCKEGTVMEGTPTTTCKEDFTWTATDLYCRRKLLCNVIFYCSICSLKVYFLNNLLRLGIAFLRSPKAGCCSISDDCLHSSFCQNMRRSRYLEGNDTYKVFDNHSQSINFVL